MTLSDILTSPVGLPVVMGLVNVIVGIDDVFNAQQTPTLVLMEITVLPNVQQSQLCKDV